jgi:hypothetical protein
MALSDIIVLSKFSPIPLRQESGENITGYPIILYTGTPEQPGNITIRTIGFVSTLSSVLPTAILDRVDQELGHPHLDPDSTSHTTSHTSKRKRAATGVEYIKVIHRPKARAWYWAHEKADERQLTDPVTGSLEIK